MKNFVLLYSFVLLLITLGHFEVHSDAGKFKMPVAFLHEVFDVI